MFKITESLEDAEFVLCIGYEHLNSFERGSVLKAKEMGISISYFTEEMLPDKALQLEMERLNKKQFISKQEEIGFSGEEL